MANVNKYQMWPLLPVPRIAPEMKGDAYYIAPRSQLRIFLGQAPTAPRIHRPKE